MEGEVARECSGWCDGERMLALVKGHIGRDDVTKFLHVALASRAFHPMEEPPYPRAVLIERVRSHMVSDRIHGTSLCATLARCRKTLRVETAYTSVIHAHAFVHHGFASHERQMMPSS